LLTRDFDYPLPSTAIAQHPAPRGASRLLVLDAEAAARHRHVGDLATLLQPGDLLVVNDTRVLPARLYGRPRTAATVIPAAATRAETGPLASATIGDGIPPPLASATTGDGAPPPPTSGAPNPEGAAGGISSPGAAPGAPDAAGDPSPPGPGEVELLLVEKVGEREWEVLVRPGRRARPGAVIDLLGAAGEERGQPSGVAAEVVGHAEGGRRRVRFSVPIEAHLERIGHIPLPPYIRRPDAQDDRERYQTVYARNPGAIAAPTAGLHLSQALLDDLTRAGVERAAVTLHVGIGTFKPVTAPLVSDHRMERERYTIPPATAAAIAAARAAGRRIVAVGTTVVRTLEGAAAAHHGDVPAGEGATDLFITPGFRFQVVSALLTNFHLPCSTLLMLVSAFAGRRRVLAAYQEALDRGYRFFSYGDAMLATHRPEAE
jgi:S-adenosylmethionine:tRNA ribosyltransferase-isomerase